MFLKKSKYKRNENNVKSTSSKSESSTDKLKCPATDTFEANIDSVSFESLWKEFQDNTTMHGIKNARKENKYKLRWVIWTIALKGMGIILGYTVPKLIAYYRTNPTLTNINVKFVKEMLYPAVTFCNMSPYKRSAVNASAIVLHDSEEEPDIINTGFVSSPGMSTYVSMKMTKAATCYYKNEVEIDVNAELKEQCKCQISCEFTTFDQSISTSLTAADVYFPSLRPMGYNDNYIKYVK
ncbi:ASIC5 [Mytilus coruscus]|uniref:ASIC5 n=1 Tax=Mytilus coruscus TaxID=42192 RepID=A0A6J8A568_MYTCO|nr:ASIC5 [Mytilus coruscus]